MPANSPDCPVNKIDSNIVGTNYAEEKCIGILPSTTSGTGLPTDTDQAGAIWRPLSPNEFDDFGGETSLTDRDPINASRQKQKGVLTDLEASGGFNQDMTHGSLQRLMQGFFFADARERANSAPISDSVEPLITLTSVSGNTVSLGTGSGAKLKSGDILQFSGMGIASNNRSNVAIDSVSGDTVTTNAVFTPESGTVTSKVEIVGFQFASGDLQINFTGEQLLLVRSTGSFINDGYQEGEWIFIGGDNPNTFFDLNGQGYARIRSVTDTTLELQEPTWQPSTDDGSGKLIQVYLGTFIRNEKDPLLIKRRSYQIERTLGQDNNGIQTEYIIGAVADELTLNLSTADKMTVDMSFMALTNEVRSGSEGPKPGNRDERLLIEDAFNTVNDVFQLRLFVNDPLQVTPSSLYAKVMEASLNIANGTTPDKCIGSLGGFDVTVGNFVVTGDLEAYFSTVEAINAVKRNADIGFNLIAAKDNTGFIFDLPLASIGGGRLDIAKDEPIKLPLEKMGAENEMGFTLGSTWFNYLPDAAMPEIV